MNRFEQAVHDCMIPTATLLEQMHADLERSFPSARRGDDYARRLGCTAKTLTRSRLATNLGKFFTRHTGIFPGAFRDTSQSGT